MDDRTGKRAEDVPIRFTGFVICRAGGRVYHRGYRSGEVAQQEAERIEEETGDECRVNEVVFE